MIVHIFPQEKFTVPFVKFINDNFNIDEHTFLIHGGNSAYKSEYINHYENVDYISLRNEERIGKFIKYVKNADKIIFHSLFINVWLLDYFSKNKELLKKSTWIVWGGDLYVHRDYPKTDEAESIEKLKMEIIPNLDCISTLVVGDYDLAKKWYNAKAKYKPVIYINPIKLECLDPIDKNENNEVINIQIGNSASHNNQHIEAIEMLKKYKSENIKIYVPLSYGDKDYALKVIKYGKECFGEKFIAITNFMNPEEYSKFLRKIDIAIFNNDRQQALGNLFALSYLGTKIYIRNNTSMWEDLVERVGYKFNAVNDIENLKFSEFIYANYKDIDINRQLSEIRFDKKYILKIWRDIFNN
jgi:hypothetical protein